MLNKSKFKIAILARSINKYITGGTRRRIEIANRLSRRGWNVTLYTFDALPLSSRWYPIKLEVPLKKRIDGIEADFVICGDIFEDPQETREGTFNTAKAKIKKIWLMQIWHRPQEEVLKNHHILKIAISTHMANMLREKYNQEPLLAIGGIDTKFFKPFPEPERFSILTYKFKQKFPVNIKTETIGESKDQYELRQKYRHTKIFLSLEQGIFFGWCNPAAEAMACGRACIAINNGSVRDLIIDGETGLLAKPEPEDIINKIEILKNTSLRKKIIKNGLHHIKQFDWEVVLDKIEEALL